MSTQFIRKETILDLTQPLDERKPHPPAFPPFKFEKLQGHGDVPLFHMYHLHNHQGTHVDAPSHFDPDGQTIDQVPISRFVARACVVHVDGKKLSPISAADIDANLRGWEPGRCLLIRTGWARHWDDEELYFSHPYLAPDSLERIVELKPSVLGLDLQTPEQPFSLRGPDYASPAHRMLMGNNILIVENLNLEPLSGIADTAFFALPPKWVGADGGQIRAIAIPNLTVE